MSPSVEPFNEAKYKALMDGLDVSEISISKVREENPYFRIDSNFFGKRIIKALSLVKEHNCIYFSPKSVVNGPFGSTITSDLHRDNGFMPLVRSLNINSGFFINKTNLIYISKEDNEKIKHSQLSKDDIVLSRVGSIGFFARIDDDLGVCNISSNNIGIKLDGYTESEKHYIITYLNTALAKALTNRRVSGNVQPKLTVSEICCIPVPTFNELFYKAISGLILSAEQARKDSSNSYEAAAATLLSTLGMPDFTSSQQAVSVKNFSDSFMKTGRLDSEYYQPKYDAYFASLQQFKTTSIPDEFDVLKNSGTNYAEGISDVGVIKTKQLSSSGVNTDGVESYFTNEVCAQNKSTFIANNDVLFASMGVGSLGKAGLFSYDGNKPFITDSTLRIYRAKETSCILPEVLCIFLQSAIGQELIYRYVVGSTGIINIYDDDIAKIPIPVLNTEVQRDIAAKVQESFALRHKSEKLLEYAKRAVEIAIEQDEETAINWLKEKGVEC